MDKQTRRPRLVTLAACAVFLLSTGHFWMAIQGILQYPNLSNLPFSVPAWYFSVNGIIWGAAWLAGAVGIWRLREWARRYLLALLPIAYLFWTLDRAVFSQSPDYRQTFWFEAALRFGLGLLLALVLIFQAKRFAPQNATT